MDSNIKIFDTPELLADSFAEDFFNEVKLKEQYNIALSGGSTPKIIFKALSENYSNKIEWYKVHCFWGDERCVPPDSQESNYKMTKETLLDKINIPESNIHRIRGEAEPHKEAERYSNELLNNLPVRNNLPFFDFVMLGLGTDGHTASIFPDRLDLFNTSKICQAVKHPETNQERITITGSVINNSSTCAFFVTGKNKSSIVQEIINKTTQSNIYPAAKVHILNNNLYWYLDSLSSSKLNSHSF
jgi:6-phosphogluconolactonase